MSIIRSKTVNELLTETEITDDKYIVVAKDKDSKKVPVGQFKDQVIQPYVDVIDGKLDLKADLQGGKIPASQLPSFVDDVLEFTDKLSFPATGEAGKIYLDLSKGYNYRWSGSQFVIVGGLGDKLADYGITDVFNKTEINDQLLAKADLQDGKIPASQLPSYVDDVIETLNVNAFPITGESGKIYLDKTSGINYRWSGSSYIKIGGLGTTLAEYGITDVYVKSEVQNLITSGKLPSISPSDVIATPTTNVWTFANGAGTYTSLLKADNSPIIVNATDGLVVLEYNTVTKWVKNPLPLDLTNYTTTSNFAPVKSITDRINPIIRDTVEEGIYWTDQYSNIIAQIVSGIFAAVKVKPNTLLFGSNHSAVASPDNGIYWTDANGNVISQILDGIFAAVKVKAQGSLLLNNDVEIIRGALNALEIKVAGTSVARIGNTANDDYPFKVTDANGWIRMYIDSVGNIVTKGTISQPSGIDNITVGVLGDSISTSDFGGLIDGEIWWQLLAKKYNWTTSVSAISGTPIAEKSGQQSFVTDSRWQSMNANGSPKIIFIEGMTNDFGAHNIPLGTINDDPVINKGNFYGGLKYLYGNLTNTFRNAKIVHLTALHRNRNAVGVPLTIPETNATTGLKLADYWKAVEDLAPWYGVTLVRLHQDSIINFNNIPDYTLDGLHPINVGHKNIADLTETTLKKLFI